jgi:hypothetical protein
LNFDYANLMENEENARAGDWLRAKGMMGGLRIKNEK